MSTWSSTEQGERARIVLMTGFVGLLLGLFQSVVWLLCDPLTPGVVTSPSLGAFLLLVAPLVWAIVYLLQGIWIGYRTGRVSHGTVTGAFTGVFGGLIAAIGHVLVMTLNLDGSNQDAIQTSYSTMGVAVLTMLLTISAGFLIGAMGAYIGQYFTLWPPQPGSPAMPPSFSPTSSLASPSRLSKPLLSSEGGQEEAGSS